VIASAPLCRLSAPRDQLLTFLDHPGRVEVTNIACERALRPAVVQRKVTNMLFTATLPVTLWFLDKSKVKGPRGDQVLFIDARHLFRQVTRAHRIFDPDHIEFLANIARLWRGQPVETEAGTYDAHHRRSEAPRDFTFLPRRHFWPRAARRVGVHPPKLIATSA
jgi:hypothetical protein